MDDIKHFVTQLNLHGTQDHYAVRASIR
jgi:hypothetical protein